MKELQCSAWIISWRVGGIVCLHESNIPTYQFFWAVRITQNCHVTNSSMNINLSINVYFFKAFFRRSYFSQSWRTSCRLHMSLLCTANVIIFSCAVVSFSKASIREQEQCLHEINSFVIVLLCLWEVGGSIGITYRLNYLYKNTLRFYSLALIW